MSPAPTTLPASNSVSTSIYCPKSHRRCQCWLAMAKDFQEIQQLDLEERDHHLGRGEVPGTCAQNPRREDPSCKGPPLPQTLAQSLCSMLRLSLLALGFNVLLLVAICVIGSQSTQLQVELRALKETFSNFSSHTLMDVRALGAHGGSVGAKITSLGAKLEKQQQDLKADHATLLLHLKHFPADLRVLACQIEFLHSNGSERTCCPVNWVEYSGSCYWFSRSGKTWLEAEKHCQLENAHLVVINSWEEQVRPHLPKAGGSPRNAGSGWLEVWSSLDPKRNSLYSTQAPLIPG
ncbi:asialoglycoprotein receptor 2 isoform X3 [Otolemur garnettii]|uniref:asialoglycoprotein receptor 2 isoform X3 n=1 Tax=Otolemur garnettii TaxID=30611 RepID=UPI000C7F2505|nr:asialoglycoprotein receptor 2 isoform X3 [Otolemur garnettii]